MLPPNHEGYVCIKLPLAPGCLPTLWNDDERFRQSYLCKFPGYYLSGDGGYVDDPKEWRKKWVELEKKFIPYLDWTGHEAYQQAGWQYLHVFQVPFYYVEYVIAQLGAYAVWRNSLNYYTP